MEKCPACKEDMIKVVFGETSYQCLKCASLWTICSPEILGSLPRPPLVTIIRNKSKYPPGFFIGSGNYYYKMDKMKQLSIFKHRIKREYLWFFLKQIWKYKKFDWWNK